MGLGMARRTKRLWTAEEKRSICFQTTAAGVLVAQVARRYAPLMHVNMHFRAMDERKHDLQVVT
jgi:transposase